MGLFTRDSVRTKALQQFAKQQKMRFEPKDTFGIVAYFKDMKLFKQGGRRHGKHVIQRKGEMFEHCGVMDYYYTISTGKSSHTYKQTVYFRVSNDLMLPAFHIFPERWYHRIRKWFGMQDIDFIAYPEFSRYYLLQGEQEDFITKFFQKDAVVGHFTKHKGWSIEAVGKYFVMYHPGMLVPLRDMRGFIKIGDTLFDLLKERNAEIERDLSPDDVAHPEESI
jgi:hypothetical protein